MRKYFSLAVLTVFLVLSSSFAKAESVGPFHVYFSPVGANPLEFLPVSSRPSDYEKTVSTRSFLPGEKQQIVQAMRYWAERTPGQTNAVTIYTGFNASEGSAFSLQPVRALSDQDSAKYGFSPNGTIYDYFVSGKRSPLTVDGIADNAIIFQTDYSLEKTRLLLNDDTIMATMLHEMGHAMGIWGSSDVTDPDEDGFSYAGNFTPSQFTAWNSHLVDIFGVKAEPGMPIEMILHGDGSKKEGVFQLYGGENLTLTEFRYPTFHGTHVDALTGGNGMPVMGGYPTKQNLSVLDGVNSLGHPGIMHSIMSYGLIRNMPFTEMEIAMFQDLGYDIDRRQFFGKSYYYDVGGDTQTNSLGFGSATAPNTSSFGLGLHVMRDNLTVTQSGHIYAAGYGGGGIRIDGVNNTLSIPVGTRVQADGDMGTGLLVSYGSQNTVRLDGKITAAGEGGIGAHFGIRAAEHLIYSYTTVMPDPDTNTIESLYEYSVVRKDLNGPLVEHFDIRGTLYGRQAALQIEEDSHVQKITAHAGAIIDGHIFSRWPRFLDNDEYATTVVFGETNEKGVVTVRGDIDGTPRANNSETFGSPSLGNPLDVRQNGATLSYNGHATVYSWIVEHGATLKGNSTISLAGGSFTNKGRMAPGNSIGRINIDGDFHNEGTLDMEFDGRGQTDTLAVTGRFIHDARGTVTVSPLADYYSGTIRLDSARMFYGGAGSILPTTFEDSISLASPTLRMSLRQENNTHDIVVSRDADAYSRFATSKNTASVGRALDALADGLTGDKKRLVANLDFSAPDGSALHSAMTQLTAAPYGQAEHASVEANLDLGRMAVQNLRGMHARQAMPGGNAHDVTLRSKDSTVSGFLMPFGSNSRQKSTENPGYTSSQAGIMGGIFRNTDKVSLSLYTAFSQRQMEIQTIARAKVRSTALHIGGTALWSEGEHGWQAWTGAQLGMENSDMRRAVSFENFHRQSEASYTAWNGLAMLGAAYLWQAGDFSFGPQIGLEYAFTAMPTVRESKGGGTRLALAAHARHQISAVGGLTAVWSKNIGEDRSVRATLETVWRQNVISQPVRIRATFVDDSHSFTTITERAGHGSLGLAGSLQVDLHRNLTLRGTVQADILRAGYASVGGGLSLRWAF